MMPVWERWLVNGLTLVVAVSGAAYGWMKYLITPSDPFAVVNHPWQSAMLVAHILSAPLLVLVVGMIVRSHVVSKLGGGPTNRRSGLIVLAAFLIMTMSGYALQVAASEWSMRLTLWVHLGSATVFAVLFGVHLVIAWRAVCGPRRVSATTRRAAA